EVDPRPGRATTPPWLQGGGEWDDVLPAHPLSAGHLLSSGWTDPADLDQAPEAGAHAAAARRPEADDRVRESDPSTGRDPRPLSAAVAPATGFLNTDTGPPDPSSRTAVSRAP